MRDGAVITVLENKNLTKDNLISHIAGKDFGRHVCYTREDPQ